MAFIKWVNLLMIFHFFAATPIFSHSTSFTSKFLDLAKEPEVFDWMVDIRRKIHENPELGYEEFKTSELIRSELTKLGIPYKYPVAVTGVIGFIGTGSSPFVALRADIDALPIQELLEWEHKSKVPGKMHACAEEGLGGAKKVLDSGALENVSAIFGLHVDPTLPIGEVTTRSGPLFAGCGLFEAIVSGKGGHAAMPQYSIDPIVAASNVVLSLQHLISRETDPLDSKVLTLAKFRGGDAFNVIPDSVTIGGTFRGFSRESMMHLKQRIKQVIIGQASVYRCNASVNFLDEEIPYIPPTFNSDELHKLFESVAGNMFGVNNVKSSELIMASEDFASYQEAMPGYIFLLGIKNISDEHISVPHNPHFQVDEDALPYGAAIHASLASNYLLKLHQDLPLVEEKYNDEL
ncbi:unnamed protein product [Lupinus luteus]|uniref:Peptidase M20 dimerisation domain-containing protein n=1 Tax=Lupinus luteus TaxID=3873 RepID=A0AAV1XR19_LUPLU